jgi:cobalamin biosynthesis protein CobC
MFPGTYNRSTFHGGDLTEAGQRYGTQDPAWIDLSTGINPNPYSVPDITAEAWHRLPSADLETDLLKSARRYYALSDDATLIAAAGTQSLIQTLPYLKAPSKVAIVTPTYAEHKICWQRAGHQITECSELTDIPHMCDIVIVVSPNNPTGTVYDIEDLKALSDKLRRRSGLLVIDEAFMDVSPDHSFGPALTDTGTIVLKSFGKFFGLAGIRLGFAAGDHSLITQLKDRLGPWAVSGVTMEVANQAVNDTRWITQTRSRLSADRQRLEHLLSSANLTVMGGTDLFSYVQTKQALQLYEHLCQQHILVRPFADTADRLRFGHPACAEDWDRLTAALRI